MAKNIFAKDGKRKGFMQHNQALSNISEIYFKGSILDAKKTFHFLIQYK